MLPLFWWFTPLTWNGDLRWPLSGAVAQDIDPTTFWALPFSSQSYRGTLDTERRIVEEAGGYGSQLGTVIDALAELLPDGDRSDAAARLADLKRVVDAIKTEAAGDLDARARAALRRLEAADRDAYAALLDDLAADR